MSGWPMVPRNRPSGTIPVLLLAWIAFCSHETARGRRGYCPGSGGSEDKSSKGKSHSKAEQQASILFIQQVFRFSTPQEALRLLMTLRNPAEAPHGAWIKVVTEHSGVKGNTYALGPGAADEVDSWVELGRVLYGPKGLLAPYLARPVMLRPPRGQGPNGCLALGLIDRNGVTPRAEIVKALQGFMDIKTARRCVDRLLGAELVLEEEEGLFTPDNLQSRIRRDEIQWGAEERARLLDRIIGDRQRDHQIRLLGGPSLARIKSSLRKESCFYCLKIPPVEGGEIEHFPPKHWGGSDKYSLLLPICRPCNGSHGPKIRRIAKTPPPEANMHPVLFEADIEGAAEWLYQLMEFRAVSYAILLGEGKIQEAFYEATTFFPTWMGLKLGVPIVNPHTGEAVSMVSGDLVDWTREGLKILGGVPSLVKARN